MGTKYEGSNQQRRALDTFIKLTRSVNALTSVLQRRLSDLGLTESQFGTLEALYHLGPMCQSDIAQKLLVSGGNMTLVINNLEKLGLVRRERNTDDRRMVDVYLTDEGRERISAILPNHVRAITEMFNVLTAAEQDQLAALSKKLGVSIARSSLYYRSAN